MGDFIVYLLDLYCFFCKNKFSWVEKGYYIYIVLELFKFIVCCLNCVVKKDFFSGM